MDLRQINYFVAAFEEGSFSAAANRLNCTASGVSQQMSALEARLCVSLFERNRRGVVATPAGRLFYDHGLRVLRTVVEAKSAMEGFSSGLSGIVSAGFGVALASAVLPLTLTKVTHDFEGIELKIDTGTADSLLSKVKNGDLDFFVGHFIGDEPSLTAVPIGHYPVCLISGVQLGLEAGVPVRLEDQAFKVVLPAGHNSLRTRIESAVLHGDMLIERSLTCTSLSTTLSFLRRTDWVTVLPFWTGMQVLGDDQLIVNPIIAPRIFMELFLIHQTQRPLSPPAQKLFDVFSQDFSDFEMQWNHALQVI